MTSHSFNQLWYRIRQHKHSALLLLGLALAFLLYQISRFGLILHQGFDAPVVATQKTSTSTGKLSNSEINEILKLNLLGKAPLKNPRTATGDPRFRVQATLPDDQFLLQVPTAKIHARLVGVISSNNPALAIAIIEYNNQQNSYFINDAISRDNNTLLRIFNDRVIIDENGYYAALLMN